MTSTLSPTRGADPCGRFRETITEVRIRVGSGRAHLRFLNPGTTFDSSNNPDRTQSVASSPRGATGDWIAAVSSLGSVNWGRTVEHTMNPMLRFGPLLQHGRSWICNSFGALSARSSFPFPLVHDANQPTRGFFHRFKFSPVLRLPVAHEKQQWQKEWTRCRHIRTRTIA